MVKRFRPVLARKLGANLANRRRALGLTQEQLAEKSKLEIVSISRYETGAALPSLTTLEELARSLSISMGELLDERIEAKGLSDERITLAISKLSDAQREYVIGSTELLCQFLLTGKNKRATKPRKPVVRR
jgi:transcriptional regulator with XRE-family HTH domain